MHPSQITQSLPREILLRTYLFIELLLDFHKLQLLLLVFLRQLLVIFFGMMQISIEVLELLVHLILMIFN